MSEEHPDTNATSLANKFSSLAWYTEWTDTTGKFVVNARYLDDGTRNGREAVLLEKKSGGTIWVLVDKLDKVSTFRLTTIRRLRVQLETIYKELQTLGVDELRRRVANNERLAAELRHFEEDAAKAEEARCQAVDAALNDVDKFIMLQKASSSEGSQKLQQDYTKTAAALFLMYNAYELGDMDSVTILYRGIDGANNSQYATRLLEETEYGPLKTSDGTTLGQIWNDTALGPARSSVGRRK